MAARRGIDLHRRFTDRLSIEEHLDASRLRLNRDRVPCLPESRRHFAAGDRDAAAGVDVADVSVGAPGSPATAVRPGRYDRPATIATSATPTATAASFHGKARGGSGSASPRPRESVLKPIRRWRSACDSGYVLRDALNPGGGSALTLQRRRRRRNRRRNRRGRRLHDRGRSVAARRCRRVRVCRLRQRPDWGRRKGDRRHLCGPRRLRHGHVRRFGNERLGRSGAMR